MQATISTAAQATDDEGWLLASLAAGEVFFASPTHQLRSVRGAGDIAAVEPADAAAVGALFARARAQGHQAPVLFGLVPFDAQQPASLSIPATVFEACCPASRALQAAQARPTVVSRTPVPDPQEYGAMVERALELFAQGDVHKIVLARAMDVAISQPVDRAALMRDLLARNSHGYTFTVPIWSGVGAESGACMMGASPELLVRRVGEQVFINPLAGSIPRHVDPVADRQRCEGLAVSEKDLREHAYVVQDIVRILEAHCTDLQVPQKPSVIGTDALWHLSTFMTGRLKEPQMTALDLGLALHPTPAMCGFPTAQAFAHIRQLEPFEREYFAGLVGWQRENGDGEWALTIRCGRYDGARGFRLYAGAGTVAGSDPASEIRETETKMATFLRAIGND